MMQRSYLVFLFLICLLLGSIKYFSGGISSTTRKTELSFWNGWTGPDGRAMLTVIRRFNDENPDVQVSMQRMDWATYYNKLMVAAMNGRGPQVFVIHASTLPRMMQAGFVADASDLYGQKTGILESDFDSKVLTQVKYGKELVGVPLDIHPQGMYCNAQMLKEAGFTNPNGTVRAPVTKEEFLKAINATQKISSDGSHSVWGFSWTMWRNNFMALVPQFHGHYFDDQGQPDLACPGNVAALEFMNELMNKIKVTPSPESNMGWVGFRQKHVAMVFDGVYMVGDLQRLDDLQYIGAPIPVIGDQQGTMADSHCLCMRTDLTPKERNAAERFIAYLSKNSIEWAAAGQVPARKSIRNSPAFAKMQVQYAFSKQIPGMLYPPRTPVLFELTLEIDLAVEKVLRGRATALQALQVANDNVKKVVERNRQESSS
ncbi:MAG TPA: extracellular solute-binding protein [Fimbriimonadaceae bacterium]|jgi:multiple sugar transport system substrate-binding protein